ncbi:tRNA U-34 5-methylaminomethyl-2-thiouridine biosynthesis protein MnmC [Leptospira broomii serovar Hurstbridge str. 5399]|uniref:tRNA 5-methylaminomethyl-2-thiouridine biosynthesis bifunctional protein MnmC n=1 Tax=Leptospira broomii serovar Hurstbridge str. 5399 TaxID=1049789 RepID=T0FAM7_9LEPT|nr:bifunctional tRNA (5-methylaminomethyl-2-thiouridine)(34)-methyltransferase MnmD/FAD-dependent 5-carboxymethylaminomethyl-2-thiouridine(34) oxidoreductase MnmC [Leptospira broomii]EQA44951.1 tRNA U-34 5-methylaminomethyl-2-thiouridine biosynthesis protein MnmC [Leptospira broomii serovar Hurstbridge str. 5399]
MIEWKENGTPVSTEFDDIYFSPEDGLAETKHVFLDGNRLESRWRRDSFPDKKHFAILELGFGTGLNFFATWNLWKKLRIHNKLSILRFVSYELFPLTEREIRRAISHFSELTEILSIFLKRYSLLTQGCNSFLFEEEGIALDLWIGDARELLPETSGRFDAFFLDGFAPSKNPELWGIPISNQFSRLADQNSTLATFTVARIVKDSLTNAGFTLEKIPGFGKKREMLIGTFRNDRSLPPEQIFIRRFPKSPLPKKVVVIGAGLAGASVARSFAIRGIEVIVLDDSSPNRASNIPKAISHPHITKFKSPTSLWTIRAFGHSLRRYQELLPKDSYEIPGTLQLAGKDLNWERISEGIRSHQLSIEIAKLQEDATSSYPSLPPGSQGVIFPSGFWTETPELVSNLLKHPNISLRTIHISDIRFDQNEWKILSEENEIETSPCLVLANSNGIESLLSKFFGEPLFFLSKVRGQLLELSTENENESDPIFVGEHYITPSKNKIRVLGSTFDEFDLDPSPRSKDRENLLKYAKELLPGEIWDGEKNRISREFVGFRSQTKDRFPVLGELHDPATFRKIYAGAGLPKNRDKRISVPDAVPGLYVFGGLGSRGVLSSLIGGETLTSIVLGEPLPIENSLYSALHPARFLYRAIRKKEEK